MSLPEWVLAISALLGAAVMLGLVAERVHLPFTVVLVLVGFLAGWAGEPIGLESPLEDEAFEHAVVFLLLPVLVFEAALGLPTRAFLRNLLPIVVLAVVALLIAAALVGITLNLVLGTPLAAALLFGALISATDPVAVVAVFRRLGVPRRLLVLVEGESMLNDGVAIVLFNVLLVGALGGSVGVGDGVLDFVIVFFGGTAVGIVVGILVGLALPWLDAQSAAALTLAAAYGGFVLADDLFGVSGVMAAVGAGLVIRYLGETRTDAEVREVWGRLWECLGYVANAILFLLIGLAIEPALIAEHAGAIALAIAVVLVSRAIAVVPLVSALERLAHIPPVGRRNEAVLVWGGLRGGVALALALALPEELEERDMFVAMTGGVVLATLLVNATTIGMLVRRLGLDQPSPGDRYLAAVARLSGLGAAREALGTLAILDAHAEGRLHAAEQAATKQLERLELTPEAQRDVLVRRGLFVERQAYQHLSDEGLVSDTSARKLLAEVDEAIEEVSLQRQPGPRRDGARLERLLERLVVALPDPVTESADELALSEATARRVAAGRSREGLDIFAGLPGIDAAGLEEARSEFARREREAEDALAEIGRRPGAERLREWQVAAVAHLSSRDALSAVAATGLLPAAVAERAALEAGSTIGDGRS